MDAPPRQIHKGDHHNDAGVWRKVRIEAYIRADDPITNEQASAALLHPRLTHLAFPANTTPPDIHGHHPGPFPQPTPNPLWSR